MTSKSRHGLAGRGAAELGAAGQGLARRGKARRTPLEQKDLRLRTKYGITLVQWQRMWVKSLGGCWICRRKPKSKSLEVDHDHKTGQVRGLLCFHCNHRLLGGPLLEDARLHEKAAAYLRSDFDGRTL